MAGEVKARMVAGAAELLARNGLQRTSFGEVLELTGSPRGSVYHHFPGGKDQLVSEALAAVSERTRQALEALRGSSPAVVTEGFLRLWRALLDHTDLGVGCAALAVSVAAESDELREAAGQVFRAWIEQLGGLLVTGGVSRKRAEAFATMLVAATEGAVAMSRAVHDRAPFDTVAAGLVEQARALPLR